MTKTLYCWRCGSNVAMLDEAEWNAVSKHLVPAMERIKQARQHGSTLKEAKERAFADALDCYLQITGFRETNADALWHHRLSLYGPPCEQCGKPLRTPRAKLCAACGAEATSHAASDELDQG